MMRGRLLLLLLCVLVARADEAHAQRNINQRQAIAPDASIRVVAQQGEVRIIGWDKDSIAVVGAVQETPSNRFALSVSSSGQGAKLGMWQEDPSETAPPSVLRVYVPSTSSVWVKTVGASISASTTGLLELISVTGSIYVTNAPRNVTAETMAGDIHVNAAPATMRVKTASGRITLAGTAADVNAVTVSGNISVALESFARAHFESVDGHIRYFGAIPVRSELDLVNHAGSITLALPAKTAAEFAFNLYEAELTDDFGMRKRWLSAPTKAREMTFNLGDKPTARVSIRSFKGPVAIRRESGPVK